ncbi:chymotrypsin-like elastase family member 1 [Saccostrea echinata]|uniref:chymotrypsin-like elastase family member 1 n=1 Tax=Saccostrea echinata TaxID=191078 RepID=UPI002A822BD8|nr:chymotrypsin-like elastase family member 1 [Saccostrea echinata]
MASYLQLTSLYSVLVNILRFGHGKSISVLPPNRLIIGGNDAKRYTWPWQAGILIADDFICGGTLIEYDVVLTAAHCLLGRSIDTYKVVLGEYDRSIAEGAEQFIKVSRFEVHPEFKGNFLGGFDVALLYLARNASDSRDVKTIRVAEKGDLETSKMSKYRCFITGWGVKSVDQKEELLANKLQEANIEVISNKKCNSKRYWDGLVKDTNLCAFYKNTAACEGDSGSPLVCKCGGSFVLVGITSWGSSTCRNYPTVFTDVAKVRCWIKAMVKSLRDTHCAVEK